MSEDRTARAAGQRRRAPRDGSDRRTRPRPRSASPGSTGSSAVASARSPRSPTSTSTVARGRVRLADRPERLRQEHAAAAGRRPRHADARHRRGLRQDRPAGAARPGLRHRLPAGRPAAVAHGRRPTSSCRSSCTVSARPSAQARVRGAARARRAHRLRRAAYPDQLSGGMQQRVAIARALAERPAAAAHGRALRCARRDDPRADAGRAGPDLRRDRRRGALRDPLDPRGGVPLRPGRGDVAASGPHRRRRRRPPGSAAALATSDCARRRGVLRHRRPGARATCTAGRPAHRQPPQRGESTNR